MRARPHLSRQPPRESTPLRKRITIRTGRPLEGTSTRLPGRNVLRLAKQLASLDVLSKGRLLVTLVPGLTYAPEREAIGVDPKQRGAVIDEALPLLRRLWAGETVSHDGAVGRFR